MIRLLILLASAAAAAMAQATLYILPNTHGTVSGWLVDFDTEHNVVLNNYLAHVARIHGDEHYRLAWSEVPNVMSAMQFVPGRMEELKRLHREKRIEFVNGFFLEPDINLSGGEALVQMGALGLRWYREVLGLRPRHCWMIDITGAHRQFPQIVAGLGLDSVFFNRNNPTEAPAFWWVAPDGTRALALVNQTYGEFGKDSVFGSVEALPDAEFAAIYKAIQAKREAGPSKDVVFALGGFNDYSRPPRNPAYPGEFLRDWNRRYPDVKVRFTVPSEYVDALRAEIAAGRAKPVEYSGDTAYSWNSFWLNMPEVRQYYRRDEHLLQAAEGLATAASLAGRAAYPSQDFYHSWIHLLMNMDRNVIWGASAGMVFKDPRHWDAWDRFESAEHQARSAAEQAARALAGTGTAVTLYNPLNWKRSDPLRLPRAVDGAPCQALAEGVVCQPELPSLGVASFRPRDAKPGTAAALPGVIETPYYVARIDAKTGALTSLKVKPSGQELLGGPANVIVAEIAAPGEEADPAHFMDNRDKRKRLASSGDYPASIRVIRGPVATQVIAASDFHGGSKLVRTMTFYTRHPRIDLDTRLDLRAENLLISADFPLSGDIAEEVRGIPYGFSAGGKGIQPAVRWSGCRLASGAGLALLDRGLTAREASGRTMILGLLNAVSQYLKRPNEMLRAQGVHEFHYALVPHAGSWQNTAIPRLAWEFNAPPLWVDGTGRMKPQSWIETSPNVIVEAVRRVDNQVEIRLAETNGEGGTAEIAVRLPHHAAALTDMLGEHPQPLAAAGPYRFPIRAQQIVTLRLTTEASAPAVAAIRDWTPLVPPAKRPALGERFLKVGHPGF